MDKNAIKKYAVWARRELISRVTQRAAQTIPIDLDDGVKVNYAKFQDVLAKIK